MSIDKSFELCLPGRNFYKNHINWNNFNSADDADVLNSDAGDAIYKKLCELKKLFKLYNAGDARKNQNVPPRVLSLRCLSTPSW